MKLFAFVALAATLTLGSFAAQAQPPQNGASASTKNKVDVTTGVIVANGALGGPVGAGAAAASSSSGFGFNQPQLVMGTTSSSAPSTFNECGVSMNINLWLVSYGQGSEGVDCVAQRQAQAAMAMFQDPVMAYELLCASKPWNEADRTSGRGKCPAQRAAAAKVSASMPPPQPVAVVVPVAAPAPPKEYPRCGAGVVDNCRG